MSIVPFWGEPQRRERVLEECAAVFYFKCSAKEGKGGGCGINISAEKVRGTTIQCPNCGKVWAVGRVNFSGVRP